MDKYLTPMGPSSTKLHVNPVLEIGPMEPKFSEWVVEGLRAMKVASIIFLILELLIKEQFLMPSVIFSNLDTLRSRPTSYLAALVKEGFLELLTSPMHVQHLRFLLPYSSRIFAPREMGHLGHHTLCFMVMFPNAHMMGPFQSLAIS